MATADVQCSPRCPREVPMPSDGEQRYGRAPPLDPSSLETPQVPRGPRLHPFRSHIAVPKSGRIDLAASGVERAGKGGCGRAGRHRQLPGRLDFFVQPKWPGWGHHTRVFVSMSRRPRNASGRKYTQCAFSGAEIGPRDTHPRGHEASPKTVVYIIPSIILFKRAGLSAQCGGAPAWARLLPKPHVAGEGRAYLGYIFS